jgi:hypothetical protein
MTGLLARAQKGESTATVEARKRELEAKRAQASRSEKVFFRVTVKARVAGSVFLPCTRQTSVAACARTWLLPVLLQDCA